MRIGIDGRVLQDHFPGIGRYLDRLLRELITTYPDDEYVVFVDSRTKNTRFAYECYLGPTVSLAPLEYSIFSPWQQVRAARTIDRHQLDVFHAPYFLTPLLLRTPLITTVHDVIPVRRPDILPSATSRLGYFAALRLALWQSKILVCDSNFVANEIVNRRFVPESKVRVAHLGVDAVRAEPISQAGDRGVMPAIQDQTKMGQRVAELAASGGFLLYVGIDKPLKNLPMLVQAYAASGVTAPLVLAGPLDERFQGTQDAISRLGVQDRVVRLGTVSEGELDALYRTAKAFLFPSLAEGFGLPPLEAMAAGVPVVCSTADSLPEVVGTAALTVNPEDVTGWSRAIALVDADQSLRERLSRCGRQRADTFTWAATATHTHQAYHDIWQAGTP